jgi:hypothetical protein
MVMVVRLRVVVARLRVVVVVRLRVVVARLRVVATRLTPPVAAPRWSTSESKTTHGEQTWSSCL